MLNWEVCSLPNFILEEIIDCIMKGEERTTASGGGRSRSGEREVRDDEDGVVSVDEEEATSR